MRAQLGVGAALLAVAALLSALLTIEGMRYMGERIDSSIAAERRIDRYAALSTQVSQFLVVATEAVQTGLSPERRTERLRGLTENIAATFGHLRTDLVEAVAEAQRFGLDAQSRQATQSLAIARMEAQFSRMREELLSGDTSRDRLRGSLDTFSLNFDPLINTAVREEIRMRGQVLAEIAGLRWRLTWIAVATGLGAVLVAAWVQYGLVRPQFQRLDMLEEAAQRLGREDFAVALPEDRSDEIGRVITETNRAARVLGARAREVEEEWARLNDTVAQRTEELRAANVELSRIDEDRRRFFADISHELRTPLTVILMEAQLAQKTTDPAEGLKIIEGRALRLNRRIDDLLRIARSESGRLTLSSAPVELAECLTDAVVDSEALVQSAGMSLTLDCPAGFVARGDANWLRQLTTGLIQNAVRHAREGGAVDISATEGGPGFEIHVADNGPGIPPDLQSVVFERFRKGSASEGFGIGLALAKWVMEEQGGTISLQSPRSETGRGLRVTLGIPKAEG
ncbi:sensor histidine kinase [Poseidonocella pacifica]|uniref:sensor histidine kinase n=1 Tax=Poseidonocella pacifica TaxID=871651 RepID=UPI001FE11B0D|nr:HAMP domain-containing sensor histidine kinase [Poseidonocella pacifica]